MRAGKGPNFDLLESARTYLESRPEVDATRVGAVGFCMGGGFAVLLAARAPLQVVATFYGDVPQDSKDLEGICPVVAGYGGKDWIFGRGAKRLEGHLDTLGVERDVKLYPEAGHSYMSPHRGVVATLGGWSPMRVGYDEGAAADSWTRMLGFFSKHLDHAQT